MLLFGQEIRIFLRTCKGCGCWFLSIGHPDFVRTFLDQKTAEHSVLLDRIPSIPDFQSAWLVLVWCATAKANFWLRTVPPEWAQAFAEAHDRGLWQCLCAIMHVNVKVWRRRLCWMYLNPNWQRLSGRQQRVWDYKQS